MPDEGDLIPIGEALRQRWQIQAPDARRLAAWILNAFLLWFIVACFIVLVCGTVLVLRLMSALIDSVPGCPFITIP